MTAQTVDKLFTPFAHARVRLPNRVADDSHQCSHVGHCATCHDRSALPPILARKQAR
jgi:cytochrome c553